MKLKGVSFIEQHVEKLVLGAVTLVLVVVLALQFVGEPNAVEVTGAQRVPPARAFERATEDANRLASALRAENPQRPEVERVSLLQRYESAARGSDAIASLPRAFGTGLPIAQVDVAEVELDGGMLIGVQLPSPARPIYAITFNTIDPVSARTIPGLSDLLPSQQPYDLQSVSVETSIPGSLVRSAFAREPSEGSGERPIPTSWWRDGIEVLAVQAERQVQRVDGSWGPSEPVRITPGRLDLLASLPRGEQLRPADMTPVLDTARSAVREVAQPLYYPTIAGPRWEPPREAAMSRSALRNAPEVRRLETRLYELEDLIADDEVRLEEAERQADRPGQPTPPPGDRGRPGDPRDPRQPQTGDRERTASPAVIRQRLEGRRTERGRLLQQLQTLGWRPPADSEGLPDWYSARIDPFLEDDGLRAWVHDLRIEPGRVYRYRTRYVINNPIFGRSAGLHPDQQSLAAEPTMVSPWSEWSDVVSVPYSEYFFVSTASDGDALSGPRAAVEVFRFYYGYWRRGTATLEPGDSIVTTIRLPDPELLPIFDVSNVRPRDPTAPGDPGFPGGDPGGDRDRFPTPPPPGGRGVPPPGGVAPPPAPGAPRPGEGGELPSQPGPASLESRIGFVLLDVSRVPGGQRRAGDAATYQVVVRSPLGTIELRRPDADRQSPLYAMMTASASQGTTQGVTAAEPEPDRTPVPGRQPTPTRPGRDRDPGGGGGGGGGGG